MTRIAWKVSEVRKLTRLLRWKVKRDTLLEKYMTCRHLTRANSGTEQIISEGTEIHLGCYKVNPIEGTPSVGIRRRKDACRNELTSFDVSLRQKIVGKTT